MRFTPVLLAGALALSLSVAAQAAPIIVKVSHVVAEKHAQGPGRAQVQGAGREEASRQGAGAGVPELAAVRRRQGNGSAAARRRADHRAVAFQVRRATPRSCRCSTCRSCSTTSPRSTASSTAPTARRCSTRCAVEGHQGARLLAQRHEAALERQGPAQASRGRQGPQVPHPGVRRARSAVPRGRRQPAEDGLQRGLPGAADRRGRRPGEHLVEHLHRRSSTRCRRPSPRPTTA